MLYNFHVVTDHSQIPYGKRCLLIKLITSNQLQCHKLTLFKQNVKRIQNCLSGAQNHGNITFK